MDTKAVTESARRVFGADIDIMVGRCKAWGASHTAFATAYGLEQCADVDLQSDVAAAAGGLTQTAIER